ncbi:MAG TPA: uracil-DNA glycosylase family protein [Chitinophagaceae bacterium]|nr:uracil-DNA glycosylase family protein [Chitinophagaceae bacterium]
MSKTLSSELIQFYRSLQPPQNLPKEVEILFPQKSNEVMLLVKKFLDKYYNDNHPRRLLFGINPGRFGGGITGVNFTAPRQLKNNCGIDHPFGNSSELSAEFIYEVIEKYGGPSMFYADYFISAVSPLGFTRDGINMNYYDDKKLQEAITAFVIANIKKQLSFGFKRDTCICIGGEKNYKYFKLINDEHKFFDEIIPLPHPRFILQYRRKQKETYIRQYLEALSL